LGFAEEDEADGEEEESEGQKELKWPK